jgi:hypothetical protein
VTIFPEFEHELRRVARRAADATGTDPRARRMLRLRWLRKTTAMLPVAASVLVAVAIAVIAIAALGQHHAGGLQHSVAADPGRRQELRYIQNANRRASQTAACRDSGRPLPMVTNGSPSRFLLRVLGVLRRPAGAADALPRSLRSAREAGAIYLKYVRLAIVKGGVSYYVAPVASLAPSRGASAACYQAHRAALNAELPQIPASARAATLALQNRQIASGRRLQAQQNRGGVCLLTESRYVIGGVCGASASIPQQGMLTDYGLVSGIVPDGTATVTARYAPTRTSRAHVVTTNVVGNVFATSLEIPHNTVDLQPTLIWRSADGTILKTIPASDRKPNGGGGFCGGRAALRQRPGMHVCGS